MPDLFPNTLEVRSNRGASACPGLFRIVPALDGGLCRIRLPLGQLAADQARAVATLAQRFGNGIVEATNRANLQLRGVAPDDGTALVEGLLDAGLGPAEREADDVRNVMVSPTAGFDPDQKIDALPIARALLTHLQSDADCRVLSPKFSLLVDGGESVAAIGHPHDIWLASLGDDAMALGIAGSPPGADQAHASFLVVPLARAVEAAQAAIGLFLDLAACNPDVTRFRHLASDGILDRLGQILDVAVQRNPEWRRASPVSGGHIGIRPQRHAGMVFVGAMPPLGRLTPQTLVGLADVAEAFGTGHLRMTPWQSVVIPGIRRTAAPHAVRSLEALGLVCDPQAPLASMIACAGSTGCAASFSDTKADALALARLLPAQIRTRRVIHLSGCAKSCASAATADVTLLASAPGTYELFREVKGSSGRFGRSMARELDIEDVGLRLRGVDAT